MIESSVKAVFDYCFHCDNSRIEELSEELFINPFDKKTFKAAMDLYKQGKTYDVVSVKDAVNDLTIPSVYWTFDVEPIKSLENFHAHVRRLREEVTRLKIKSLCQVTINNIESVNTLRLDKYLNNFKSKVIEIFDNTENDQIDIYIPENKVEPFPISALPNCLQNFIREGSRANCCSPDLIAVPSLGGIGAAIGNNRILRVKRGWEFGSNLYVCVISPPGTAKSPAQNEAIKPIRRIQATMADQYLIAMEKYKSRLNNWELECSIAKSEKRPKPEKPIEPYMNEIYTCDSTIEAMAEILERNPRGISLIQDEVTAWINGMNQYKGGKGSDKEFWLSSWSRVTTKINRKGKIAIIIKDPFISVIGAIPPAILGTLTNERSHGEDGFIHRILFCFPDIAPNTWTDNEIDHQTSEAYYNLFLKIRNELTNQEILNLSREAYHLWVDLYNDIANERNDEYFPENLHGPWAKMPSQLARIALIIHVVRHINNETKSKLIDYDSMAMSGQILNYFKSHTKKVYSRLTENVEDEKTRRVFDWCKRHNRQEFTTKDLQMARFFAKSNEVHLFLKTLENRGFGRIQESQGRGKRSKKFILAPNKVELMLS